MVEYSGAVAGGGIGAASEKINQELAKKKVKKEEVEQVDEGIGETIGNFIKLAKNKAHKVSTKTPMGKAVTGIQKRTQANNAAAAGM